MSERVSESPTRVLNYQQVLNTVQTHRVLNKAERVLDRGVATAKRIKVGHLGNFGKTQFELRKFDYKSAKKTHSFLCVRLALSKKPQTFFCSLRSRDPNLSVRKFACPSLPM